MTLCIALASPRHLIMASDRRLTRIESDGRRRVVSERSTKLTVLYCRDGLALIAYNGIGLLNGKTPADWLQELAVRVRIWELSFADVLTAIREEADRRIGALGAQQGRRHSFIVGAWGRGRTWIVVISNYESALEASVESTAKPYFEATGAMQVPGSEVRVLVAGDTTKFDPADASRIVKAARHSGAGALDLKNMCVKAIRSTAIKNGRNGTVGSSVLWATAERYKGVEANLDVSGGTRVLELPNIISANGLMNSIRFEAGEPNKQPLSWGQPPSLPEPRCTSCGTPIPLGYARCDGCGAEVA